MPVPHLPSCSQFYVILNKQAKPFHDPKNTKHHNRLAGRIEKLSSEDQKIEVRPRADAAARRYPHAEWERPCGLGACAQLHGAARDCLLHPLRTPAGIPPHLTRPNLNS